MTYKNILNTVVKKMASHEESAARLEGFNLPRVWTIMAPLAIQTQSVNLGQGFPSWQPPQFYRNFLKQAIQNSNHQYGRAFGALNYTKAIAQFHKKTFGQLDHENNIVTVNGGSEGLYCAIMALVNPGQQVVIFDPAYDCYRPQVQIAGGKTIGVCLKPKKHHTKEEILKRISETGVVSTQEDVWEIDFDEFEKVLNQKTRIVIITTPHNPVGKVFTQEQLAKIAVIVRKFPGITIIQDNVYEGMTFDSFFGKPLPKIIHQEGMYERTLSIYSGGKILQATGVRCGWVIGPANLIQSVRSVHQYNTFCQYNIVENTVAKCLEEIAKPQNTYMIDYAVDIIKKRDLLVTQLLKSKFDFDLWIPQGGHFIVVDISKVQIMEKYWFDDKGVKRTKDYAFAYQLANENRVAIIPCSPFYGKQNQAQGQKYIRIAFCKGEDLIEQAGKRLRA